MAHFAKLTEDNVVLAIEVVADADTTNPNTNLEDESTGIAYLQGIHGWAHWKKCSRNTYGGKYYNTDNTLATDQSKAFRLNYPGIGWVYNSTIDGFTPQKPQGLNSWVLNETTGEWKPPIERPTLEIYGETEIDLYLSWDEANVRWTATDKQTPQNSYRWDVDSSSWIII